MPILGTYGYFLKHPRNFYSWMEVGAETAQYFGSLSGKALMVAKNICKAAAIFQMGCDIHFAFKGFRTLYGRMKPIEAPPVDKPPAATAEPTKTATPKAPPKTAAEAAANTPVTSPEPAAKVLPKLAPLWIEGCYAISNAALLTDFGRQHIFEQPSFPLLKLAETVANLMRGGYDLYIFIAEWKNKPIVPEKKATATLTAGGVETKKKPNGQSDLSWNLITIAELTHRVSFLFLTALSLAPYFKGIDHVSPLFTIFFTTLYLGSHFVFYEDKKNAPTVVLFREYNIEPAK